MTEFEDNNKKFEELREKYPTFAYENFFIEQTDEGLKFSFEFRCSEITFRPYQILFKKHFILFRKEFTDFKKEFHETAPYSDHLKLLVFNLGLVELISYWKAVCSPKIIIKCGYLDEKQQQFWKKLWFNGLGEFFYLNNIKTNINDFVHIECSMEHVAYKTEKANPTSYILHPTSYIVPVGGGKDSVVTLELLRAKGKNITPMVINQRKATRECIERSGYSQEDTIEVKRIIDKNLLELNKQGYLNGHTPFSAMLVFTTLICAHLSGKKFIALSNENSANEAMDKISGANHQYSKSLEFENDFRAYYKEYLCKDIEYFSFLRPISELKIAQIFSYLNYFDVFKSCNVGSKQDIWCGNCPKCLFAYIILSPFANPDILYKVFNKNMFADGNLLTYFKELTGEAQVKPFECVGTVSEVNMALCERIRIFGIKEDEILLKHYIQTPVYEKYKQLDFQKFLNQQDENNNLPEELKDSFDNSYILAKKSALAHKLKDEKIAVMGLGREGISTLRLLNGILPDKQLILYDENKEKFSQIKDLVKNHRTFSSKDDLTLINNESTLIFFTPGMAPKNYPQLDFDKLTNQCSQFLQLFSKQCIGITGTKGKSTTSSLVYHILKANNQDTVLAGNIGVPFFDILNEINEQTKIVLELSCHQLQLIKQSPHVSALLNLYEEHLDHYIDFEDYQNAKLNLLFKANKGDIFIYNGEDKITKQRLSNQKSECNLISFALSDYKWQESEFLRGEHNKYNILAAVNAVKSIGISENDAVKSALTFTGLHHRMEFLGENDGVAYYDDSISTIPQATLAAVKSLPNVATLILGGMDRGIDYSPLKELKNIPTLKNIVFVGKAGMRMYDYVVCSTKNVAEKREFKTLITDDWNAIAQFCKANTEKGSSVLLSPAASSYDQFRNFEHRGEFFKDIIFNM